MIKINKSSYKLNLYIFFIGLFIFLFPVKAEEVLPIVFEKSEDFSTQGRALRIPQRFSQDSSNRLIMEAEDATDINWEGHPDAGIHYDKFASGKAYISHVEKVAFSFSISKAQKYRVWMRTYFTHHGHWNHTESMDTNDVSSDTVDDLIAWNPNHPKLRKWIWVKGSSYQLSKGSHRFAFSYKAGCRLDKVILLLETASHPGELGSLETMKESKKVKSYTLLSKSIEKDPGTLRIDLSGHLKSRGGKSHLEISEDRKSWTVLSDMKALGKAVEKWPRFFLKITYEMDSQKSPIWFNHGLKLYLKPLEVKRKFDKVVSVSAYPLFPRKMAGVIWDGHKFQLASQTYRVNSSDEIYCEIEKPQVSRLKMDPVAIYRKDPSASGGQYIDNDVEAENYLQFSMVFTKTKDYTVWVRLRPRYNARFSSTVGNMMWDVNKMKTAELNTSVFMQKASAKIGRMYFQLPESSISKSKRKKNPIIGKWQWLKGDTQMLMAGIHTLYINGGFAYSDIDRIAILPKGQVPVDSIPNSLVSQLQRGEVTFSPIFPIMGRVPIQVSPNKAAWEFSVDGGATFISLPSHGKLPLHDYRKGNLILKAILNSSNASELLYPKVTLDKEVEVVEIKSENLSLHFGTQSGKLLGLYNLSAQRWITPFGKQSPILNLYYDVPGEGVMRMLNSSKIRVEKLESIGVQSFSATYRLLGDAVKIKLQYSFGSDGLCKSTISAQNMSNYNIREISYLNIDELRTTVNPITETLCWPNYFGSDFPFPSGGFSASTSITYPGTASLSFFCLGDEKHTLYVSERQTNLLHHTMSLFIPQANETLGFSINKSICVLPNTNWTGDYCLGIIEGDWHAAADIHREWLYSWLPPAEHPDWVKDSIGFWNNYIRFFTRLPISGAMINDWYGMHYNQIWGWTGDGDYIGCYPIPDVRLGTQEEAKPSFRDFIAKKNQVGYYMNAQEYCDDFRTANHIGWSLRKHFPKKYASLIKGKDFFNRNIQRTLSGEKRYEPVYMGTKENGYEMCVTSDEWHQYHEFWMGEVWVKDYGVNALYFDQAGCIVQKCFSPNHGHGFQHASSGLGFHELIRKTLASGRKHDPSFTIGIEGAIDNMTPYSIFGLWVGSNKLKGNLFKYVLPNAVLARGISNSHSNRYVSWDECMRDVSLYSWVDAFRPSTEQLIRVRQHTRPFVTRARFMDTVGLKLKKVQGDVCWFLRNEAGWQTAAVVIHNKAGQEGGVCQLDQLPFVGPFYTFCFAEGEFPKSMSAQVRDGSVVLPVPSSKFSILVIVKKVPEKDSLLMLAERPLVKGRDIITTTLLNLSKNIQKPVFSFSNLPENIEIEQLKENIEIKPGYVEKLIFNVNHIQTLKRWEKIKAQVSSDKAVSQKEILITPTIVNGSMEEDQNGDNLVDAWSYFFPDLWDRFLRANQKINLQEANGVIDTKHYADGKNSLLLAEPMDDYEMDGRNHRRYPPYKKKKPRNRSVQTPIVLKPDTTYQLKAKFRTSHIAPNQIEVSIIPGKYSINKVVSSQGKWFEYISTFTTKSDDPGLQYLKFDDTGGQKVWIDAVKLKEKI